MVCAGSRSTGVPFYPRRRHSGHVSLKYPRRSNVEGGARFALEENDLYRRKDTLLMSLSPKTNLASLSLAILAGLGLAAAHPANAQVLYAQPYDGVSGSTPSQAQVYSGYAFDDFTVTGTGWDISQVTAFGNDSGDSTKNSAVSLAFTTEPNASAEPDVSAITPANTYAGVEDASGNLVFTKSIHLNPGNYFITAFTTRNLGNGGWYFNDTKHFNGQDSYFSGYGFGTSTFHFDPGHDLAFEIDGAQNGAVPPAVPEPSSVLTFAVAALGIGGLMIAAKRKKAAPPLSSPLPSSL